MAKHSIELRKTETIANELDRLQRQISERAYALFMNRNGSGDAMSDWLSAENELVWKPAVEVRQKDTQLEVLAALPGVDARDVDVQVTPEEMLIQAETHHAHKADKGTVHTCEFKAGRVFRSVRFPAKIDPRSVKAQYHDGMLALTASLAESAAPRESP